MIKFLCEINKHLPKLIESIIKYGKQIYNCLSIETTYSYFEKDLIHNFMCGITYKMSLYLNYISDNGIFFEDKAGLLFFVSCELSKFDEIYDKNQIVFKKRYIDTVGPAIELWIQNM